MSRQKAFQEAIRKNPADDGPRLIYADWLEERGDPLGEFIRVQCALAKKVVRDKQFMDLKAREKQLLEAHQEEWIPKELGYRCRPLHIDTPTFDRGFPCVFRMDQNNFMRHGEALHTLSPIGIQALELSASYREGIAEVLHRGQALLSLDVSRDDPLNFLQELTIREEAPGFPQLEKLNLYSNRGDGNRGDGEIVRLLARNAKRFPSLRSLRLSSLCIEDVCGWDNDNGHGIFSRLAKFKKLETLDLSNNKDPARISDEYVGALTDIGDKFKVLRALTIKNAVLSDGSAQAFAENAGKFKKLEALDLSGNEISSVGFYKLVEKLPRFKALESLNLSRNQITAVGVRDAIALMSGERKDAVVLDKLKVLDLSGNPIHGDEIMIHLGETNFPALEHICVDDVAGFLVGLRQKRNEMKEEGREALHFPKLAYINGEPLSHYGIATGAEIEKAREEKLKPHPDVENIKDMIPPRTNGPEIT